MLKPVLSALLYAGLALSAIPLTAEPLSEAERTVLIEMRTGTMKKLAFVDPVDVSQITFQDAAGNPVKVSDSNGKVRVLNFWATWCAPCREEKPALDALNKQLNGPDFEVIAVATGRNKMAAIERFNEEHNVTSLEIFLDPSMSAAREMGVLGLPVTVILDRDGYEIARVQGGADWAEGNAAEIIKRIIAGSGS